jgi:hypothetical protein
MPRIKTSRELLAEECEEILRTLMVRHACLQLQNKDFDVWDRLDASDIVADLISLLKKSDIIETEHIQNDWGK